MGHSRIVLDEHAQNGPANVLDDLVTRKANVLMEPAPQITRTDMLVDVAQNLNRQYLGF